MNSIFNKNIDAFQKRLPLLYEVHADAIQSFSNSSRIIDYEHCQITASRIGLPSLKENGVLVHSSYNPENEALKSLQTDILQDKMAAVFLSFGLGYGPIAFSKLYPGKTLILIEPDIIRVLWTFQFIDFTPVFAHSSLICLFEAEHRDCIGIFDQIGIHQCHFIEHSFFTMHAQPYFTGLSDLIERNKQKKEINDNTLEKFGKLWLKNSIKNAHVIDNLESIQNLKGIHAKEKAFILAAGPSLGTVLPFLHQIQQKAVLICVDTALRSCLNAGIEPDYVILVDPQYWNARHIEGLSSPRSTLITEIAAYPSVFRFSCRQIQLCSSLYPFGQYIEKHLGEFGKLSAGGSVATTAWDFAQWIGCTEIYFAGLDLSYPDTSTHVRGSTFEEKAVRNAFRITTVETSSVSVLFSAPTMRELNYENKQVLTDSRMKLYAWWFESKCASFPHIKTFSVTQKSMKIPGIHYFALDDFLQLQNRQRKENNYSSTTKNNSIHSLLEKLLENVHETAYRVHEGIQLSTQASKILFENNKQQDLLKKLEDIDHFISSSELKNTLSLVFPSQKRLDQLYESSGLDKKQAISFLTSIQQSKILYTEILHGLKLLQTLLEKTIQNTHNST